MDTSQRNRKLLTNHVQSIKSTMKVCRLIPVVILIASIIMLAPVLSQLTGSVLIRSSGTIAAMLPLHVEGRWIKNSYNTTVTLKGVDQTGFLDSANGWWNPQGGAYTSGCGVWNPAAVKYNLDSMRSWGVNAMRLLITAEWWIYDTSSYRQHIKDVIGWAAERGIYTIIVPWNVLGNGGQTDIPFPPYSTAEEQVVIPSQQAFVDFWTSVAGTLKSYTNVIFELWNEPVGDDLARNDWFGVVQRCVTSIRGAGANQIILVQWGYGVGCNLDFPPPDNWAATMDWVEMYPLSDPYGNIVYSIHNYRGDVHNSTATDRNCYKYEDMKLGFQYCLVDYVLNTLNKPVLVGEIGANMWNTGVELDKELQYFNNSLTIFDEWHMSYLAWIWSVPAHLRHGLLENGYPWLPPPSAGGLVLKNHIST